MTAYVMVRVTCDKIIRMKRCGRSEVVEEADSRSIARLILAEEKGWKTMQVKGKLKDYCPDHDPVKEGIADEANTTRTNARMKNWLDMNRRNSMSRTITKAS